MEPALKDILDAEKKAKKIIEDAEKEKISLIGKAKQDALTLVTKEKDEIDGNKDDVLKKEEKKIINETEMVISAGKREVDNLEASAKKNMGKAEKFAIDKFEELLD